MVCYLEETILRGEEQCNACDREQKRAKTMVYVCVHGGGDQGCGHRGIETKCNALCIRKQATKPITWRLT